MAAPNFGDLEYMRTVVKDSNKSRLMSDAEVAEMEKAGQLPSTVGKDGAKPRVYAVKDPALNHECIVMLMEKKCGCTRLPNGKRQRCKKHERKHKAKKARPGMVQDDNSDRMVVSGLKRVDASEMEDGDDDKIDGAYTPDMIYTLGPTGVPVYAKVSTDNNPNAAPKATKDMPTTDGILVRGPMDCPQFIPTDKIPKRKDGKNRYANFTNGKLVKNKNSEHIFVPADGPQLDAPVQLNELQKLLVESNVACAAEIGPKGMCEMRAISGAQKNADAPIGVVVTENGKAYFCQVGGAPLGAGETAQYLATYDKNAPPGAVLAKVLIKDGKAQAYTPAQAANMKNETFRGIVAMGDKRQPVYVPGANPTEAEIKAAIARAEALQSKWPEIFAADAATKSKLAGTSVDEAKLAIKESESDAASVAFMNANEGFRQSSVFMYKDKDGAPGTGTASGRGAAVAGGAGSCPPGAGPDDVRSAAFGMNGYQYEPQSKYLNR